MVRGEYTLLPSEEHTDQARVTVLGEGSPRVVLAVSFSSDMSTRPQEGPIFKEGFLSVWLSAELSFFGVCVCVVVIFFVP